MPTSTPHDDRAEFAADQAAAPARLRPLTEDDLDPLVVLQREGAVRSLSHVFVQRDHPFPSDEIREQWATEIADPGIECFAPVRGDELVGFVATKEMSCCTSAPRCTPGAPESPVWCTT